MGSRRGSGIALLAPIAGRSCSQPGGRTGSTGRLSRDRGRFLGAVPIIACLAFFVVPASAHAASVRASSGHSALQALQRYFTTLVANVPASQQSEESYVASIRSACPNVLAAVDLIPESSVNAATAMAFGEELGLDVSLASFVPDRTPLATLTGTLSKLRWSSRRQALKIRSALEVSALPGRADSAHEASVSLTPSRPRQQGRSRHSDHSHSKEAKPPCTFQTSEIPTGGEG
jgi:hypothetical protein